MQFGAVCTEPVYQVLRTLHAEPGLDPYIIGDAIVQYHCDMEPEDAVVVVDAPAERVLSLFKDITVLDKSSYVVHDTGAPIPIMLVSEKGDYLTSLYNLLSSVSFTAQGVAYSPWRGFVYASGAEFALHDRKLVENFPIDRLLELNPCALLEMRKYQHVYGFSVSDTLKEAGPALVSAFMNAPLEEIDSALENIKGVPMKFSTESYTSFIKTVEALVQHLRNNA